MPSLKLPALGGPGKLTLPVNSPGDWQPGDWHGLTSNQEVESHYGLFGMPKKTLSNVPEEDFTKERVATRRFRTPEGQYIIVLAADISTTLAGDAATPVAFTIPVVASRSYLMEFFLMFTTAATTTGYRVFIDGPASPTSLACTFLGQTNTTTASSGTYQVNSYIAGYSSSFDGAATGNNPCNGYVHLINGANGGNVVLAVRSEVSGSSITIKAGSFVRVNEYN